MGFDYRTSTELGKEILGEHKQNLECTRTQEKGVMTPQETDPHLPVSVQESPVEAWVSSGLLQGHTHTQKSVSRVRLFATPWIVAHMAPWSMGFSRHDFWSGLPFPSPGDLPDPGVEPGSPTL